MGISIKASPAYSVSPTAVRMQGRKATTAPEGSLEQKNTPPPHSRRTSGRVAQFIGVLVALVTAGCGSAANIAKAPASGPRIMENGNGIGQGVMIAALKRFE